jgi:NADH:ubiquinone oxidoreductase subunit 5 (subunit L)/multisubunit Na+/H+ antiporter MnhA subunit
VDELYQWVIDHVVLAAGDFVALYDRVVINDVGVDGSARTVMLSALRLRHVQTGRLYNYGLAMALGVVGLVLVWWLVLA